MMRRAWLVAATAVFVVAGPGVTEARADAARPRPVVPEITVAAASDLRPAFEELGRRFTARTGTKVTFSFGSSGLLHQQVVNGAPFDLFASADVGFVNDVIRAGRGVRSTKAPYAFGRIVLVAAQDGEPPTKVADLTDPRYRRIAIANPEHAPYGRAAEEALRSTRTHDAVKDRLVYGENVSDTFRIVQSGNADAGIVALSLAIAAQSPYTLVPERLHEPLKQALVVTGSGARGKAAARFAAFIGRPAGREVMVRYGFVLPGERAPTA